MIQLVSLLRRLLRILWSLLISPLRLYQSIRNSMTGASASILIVAIITLNIIWGYPWTGMFGAMVALLAVGFAVNRVMKPRLRLGFSLPRSAPAGAAFTVVTHIENRSRLPAIDLSIAFDCHRSRSSRTGTAVETPLFESLSPDQYVTMVHPHSHVDMTSSVRFGRRGVHELPKVVVHSLFPFHLFRSTSWLASDAQIAVTPKLLSGDDDEFSREMLSALGGWSRKLLSGDDMDYTGSREYQVGMPVRRWDFSSWARLGRPIVREFQSPSVQAITLVVDTTAVVASGEVASDALFERLLSLAATTIGELTRKLVHIRLYLTDEDPAVITAGLSTVGTVGDGESMLIRLAAASHTPEEQSEVRVGTVLEHVGGLPVLVLTLRPEAIVWQRVPPNVTVLRSDAAHQQPPGSQVLRRGSRQDSSLSIGVD